MDENIWFCDGDDGDSVGSDCAIVDDDGDGGDDGDCIDVGGDGADVGGVGSDCTVVGDDGDGG